MYTRLIFRDTSLKKILEVLFGYHEEVESKSYTRIRNELKTMHGVAHMVIFLKPSLEYSPHSKFSKHKFRKEDFHRSSGLYIRKYTKSIEHVVNIRFPNSLYDDVQKS